MVGIGEALIAMNVLGLSAAGMFWKNPEQARVAAASSDKYPAAASYPAPPETPPGPGAPKSWFTWGTRVSPGPTGPTSPTGPAAPTGATGPAAASKPWFQWGKRETPPGPTGATGPAASKPWFQWGKRETPPGPTGATGPAAPTGATGPAAASKPWFQWGKRETPPGPTGATGPVPPVPPPPPGAPPPPPPPEPASDEAKEPEPMGAKDQQKCKEILATYGIFSKKDFNRWAVKNHPDKGGDTATFQRVSDCAKYGFPPTPAATPTAKPATPKPEWKPKNPKAADFVSSLNTPTPTPSSDESVLEELAQDESLRKWRAERMPKPPAEPELPAPPVQNPVSEPAFVVPPVPETALCEDLPADTKVIDARGDGLCLFRSLLKDDRPNLPRDEETKEAKALARKIRDELLSKEEYNTGIVDNVKFPDETERDMTFQEYVNIIPDADEKGVYPELEIVGNAATEVLQKNIAVYTKLPTGFHCVMHYPHYHKFPTTVHLLTGIDHFDLLKPVASETPATLTPPETVTTTPATLTPPETPMPPDTPYTGSVFTEPPPAPPKEFNYPVSPLSTVVEAADESTSVAPPSEPLRIGIPPASVTSEEESTGPPNSDVSRLSMQGEAVRDKIRRIITRETVTNAVNKLSQLKTVVNGLAAQPPTGIFKPKSRGGARVPSVVLGLSRLDSNERREVYTQVKKLVVDKYELTDEQYEEDFVIPLEESINTYTSSSSGWSSISNVRGKRPKLMSQYNVQMTPTILQGLESPKTSRRNSLVQGEQSADALEAPPAEQENPIFAHSIAPVSPPTAPSPPSQVSKLSQVFQKPVSEPANLAPLGSPQNPVDARQRAIMGLPKLTRDQILFARKVLGMKAGTRRRRVNHGKSTFRRKRKTTK